MEIAALLGDVDFARKLECTLRVDWPGDDGPAPTEAQRRVLERTSIVLLTWDPFAWSDEIDVDRTLAVHPGDDYRLTVYLTGLALDGVAERPSTAGIGAHVERVVRTAAEHEDALVDGSFDERCGRGQIEWPMYWLDWVPEWPEPDVVEATDWRPLGAETATDYVAAVTGFVPFDPPTQRLGRVDRPVETCPGCRGLALRVPFELEGARGEMCSPHRAETNAHLARLVGPKEEADGWAWSMFAEVVGYRLHGSHVPAPLADDVTAALADDDTTPIERSRPLGALLARASDKAELTELASDLGWDGYRENPLHFVDAVIDAVAHQLGHDREFAAALQLIDEAVRLGLDGVGALHAQLAANAADAGESDLAREQIELALAAPTLAIWNQITVASAEVALGDSDAGEARLRSTIEQARAEHDALVEHDALQTLVSIVDNLDDPARADDLERLRREESAAARNPDRLRRVHTLERQLLQDRFGRKVGRNEPCPCGSGKKFKRCHGR